MFALIAVIVKPETGGPLQLGGLEKIEVQDFNFTVFLKANMHFA